jgi:hypothetical protein
MLRRFFIHKSYPGRIRFHDPIFSLPLHMNVDHTAIQRKICKNFRQNWAIYVDSENVQYVGIYAQNYMLDIGAVKL